MSAARNVLWVDATAGASGARALARNLAVVLETGGIGAKDETVLPVAKGIDENLEAVAFLEIGIAAAVRNDDSRGIIVVAHDTDVQGISAVGDINLGGLGSGCPFFRLHLPEAARRRRAAPGRIIEHVAVERGFFGQSMGHGDRRLGWCGSCSRRGNRQDRAEEQRSHAVTQDARKPTIHLRSTLDRETAQSNERRQVPPRPVLGTLRRRCVGICRLTRFSSDRSMSPRHVDRFDEAHHGR